MEMKYYLPDSFPISDHVSPIGWHDYLRGFKGILQIKARRPNHNRKNQEIPQNRIILPAFFNN